MTYPIPHFIVLGLPHQTSRCNFFDEDYEKCSEIVCCQSSLYLHAILTFLVPILNIYTKKSTLKKSLRLMRSDDFCQFITQANFVKASMFMRHFVGLDDL